MDDCMWYLFCLFFSGHPFRWPTQKGKMILKEDQAKVKAKRLFASGISGFIWALTAQTVIFLVLSKIWVC